MKKEYAVLYYTKRITLTTIEQKKMAGLQTKIDEIENKLRTIVANEKNKSFAKNIKIIIRAGYHS